MKKVISNLSKEALKIMAKKIMGSVADWVIEYIKSLFS